VVEKDKKKIKKKFLPIKKTPPIKLKKPSNKKRKKK